MVAEKITRLRKGRFTLGELAKRSGVSKSHLHEIEAGRTKNPSGKVCYRIAVALGVSVDYLLEDGIKLETAEDHRFVSAYLAETQKVKFQVREILKILRPSVD